MSNPDNQEHHQTISDWIESLPLIPPVPCSYYQDRQSRIKAFLNQENMPLPVVDYLLSQGFRRSGYIFYQNHCPTCTMCLSYRIPLHDFSWERDSIRRLYRKNSDISIRIQKPQMTSEKKRIYLRYQKSQHFDNPPREMVRPEIAQEPFSPKSALRTMHEQMYRNTENSFEMEIWLQDRILSYLIFDMGSDALSAVYLVYDPDLKKRSPGKLTILKFLEYARQEEFTYVYLGFYLPGHSKMAYKFQYQPAQILDTRQNEWKDASAFMNTFAPH